MVLSPGSSALVRLLRASLRRAGAAPAARAAAGDGGFDVLGAKVHDCLPLMMAAAEKANLIHGRLAAPRDGVVVMLLERVPRTMPQRQKSSCTTGIILSTGES